MKSVNVALSSVHGKLIYSQNFENQNQLEIKLNEKQGIYILSIVVNNEIRIFKLVIK